MVPSNKDDSLITMDSIEDLMARLSKATYQDDDGIFYKTLLSFLQRIDELDDWIETINQHRCLYYMSGQELDNYAYQYGIDRAGADDDYFRFKIQAMTILQRLDGTVDSIITAISFIMKCDPSEVNVFQNWQIGGESRVISIKGIPFKYSSDTKAVTFLVSQLKHAVEATTRLDEVSFSQEDSTTFYYGSFSTVQERYIIQAREI